MNRWMAVVVFLVVPAVCLGTGAEKDPFMGTWEGEWYGDEGGGGRLSAQVVAEGKGNYRAVLSVDVGETKPVKGEMRGKKEGEKASLKGSVDAGTELGGAYECAGEIVAKRFTGSYSGAESRGRFELKKVSKKSPTLGAKPPEGATVLFDGKDLSKWSTKDGKPNPWKSVDGAMEVRGGDIMTKDEFGDFRLHLEFCVPLMAEARDQGRGNSGIFLPGNCEEVQILDSFGSEASDGSCGAIYAQRAPDANASFPPGEWQTYDITCLVPRFDETGKMIQKTIITVYHNGVLVHDRFPAKRATGRRHGEDFRRILLQDHGNPVRFRNIWLVPLKAE